MMHGRGNLARGAAGFNKVRTFAPIPRIDTMKMSHVITRAPHNDNARGRGRFNLNLPYSCRFVGNPFPQKTRARAEAVREGPSKKVEMNRVRAWVRACVAGLQRRDVRAHLVRVADFALGLAANKHDAGQRDEDQREQ